MSSIEVNTTNNTSNICLNKANGDKMIPNM